MLYTTMGMRWEWKHGHGNKIEKVIFAHFYFLLALICKSNKFCNYIVTKIRPTSSITKALIDFYFELEAKIKLLVIN